MNPVNRFPFYYIFALLILADLWGSTTHHTEVKWLDSKPSKLMQGTAFGVPWPKGLYPQGTEFRMEATNQASIPLQTWTTATWPDGSLKWTGHAIGPGQHSSTSFKVVPGSSKTLEHSIKIAKRDGEILVNTGIIECHLPTKGPVIISEIRRNGQQILKNGHLVGSIQNSPKPNADVKNFYSSIKSVSVEQSGPIRSVIKINGVHRIEDSSREWLPFSVRLYFHSGSDSVRMTHTFVFDGDENKDFLSGLGIRFHVPMQDEMYNRHIRFAGQNGGIWAEAIQGLTGIRRDPGAEVRLAQINGQAVPDIRTWSELVSTRIHWVPTWGDFTLRQPNANGFSIQKRTQDGCGWIAADQGGRAAGTGYIGGASGGVIFGMRDFWQLHPTQLDVRNANTEKAQVTLWIWSPDVPPMDIRFYHDGLGQGQKGPLPHVMIEGINTSVPDHPYQKQTDALQITYEDYEPGFGTPKGVARTTDIFFKICATTPSREDMVQYADEVSQPPQLIPTPETLHHAKAFGAGSVWSLPNRTSPQLSAIEDRLAWSIQFYADQVEQRHWYGFWNYGDFMHSYDHNRHVWKYDIGGYGWDNSELSTDMWLWYSFLRTGDAKAFRLAEAMNRHNRDIDIYHLGRFAGFGSRHNVQHWGCSAKQLRISTCMNRRFHYYLTTDERTGDVLNEVIDADRQLANLNARRKVMYDTKKAQKFNEPTDGRCRISIGTDYGAALANWLTAWERTGDPKIKAIIEKSMQTIANTKGGFFVNRYLYDPKDQSLSDPEDGALMISHLSIMFGLSEVVAEIVELIDMPKFKQAWLQYGSLIYASEKEKIAKLGTNIKSPGFKYAHARVMAYAAAQSDNEPLKLKAAQYFLAKPKKGPTPQLNTQKVSGPLVLNPVQESNWVSTNTCAQWGLAAMQVSALIPDAISQEKSHEHTPPK